MVAVSLNRNDSPIYVILISSFINNDDDGGSVFFFFFTRYGFMENYPDYGNCIFYVFFLFAILINFYTFLCSQDQRNHSLFILSLFNIKFIKWNGRAVLLTREIFSHHSQFIHLHFIRKRGERNRVGKLISSEIKKKEKYPYNSIYRGENKMQRERQGSCVYSPGTTCRRWKR